MQCTAQDGIPLPKECHIVPASSEAMVSLCRSVLGAELHGACSAQAATDMRCPGLQRSKTTRYALDYLDPGKQLPRAGASDTTPATTTHDLAAGTTRGGPHIAGAGGETRDWQAVTG